jgi:hypothetical protein
MLCPEAWSAADDIAVVHVVLDADSGLTTCRGTGLIIGIRTHRTVALVGGLTDAIRWITDRRILTLGGVRIAGLGYMRLYALPSFAPGRRTLIVVCVTACRAVALVGGLTHAIRWITGWVVLTLVRGRVAGLGYVRLYANARFTPRSRTLAAISVRTRRAIVFVGGAAQARADTIRFGRVTDRALTLRGVYAGYLVVSDADRGKTSCVRVTCVDYPP